MTKMIFRLTLALGLLCCVTAFSQDHVGQLTRYMQAQTHVNNFSGAVLVSQKGIVVFEQAFGYANRDWLIANTTQTKFRIASLTKQFTAAAILKLVEEGKLSLDDRVSRFIPGYPKGESVTIHMLLNHTSGIRNQTALPNRTKALFATPMSPDSLIALFRNEPYDFSPGSKFAYNNSGYVLLGYIIEKVTGMSYAAYMNEILHVKGFKYTGVDHQDSVLAMRATGYVKTPSTWMNARYITMEAMYSAGAMYSTLRDLLKWQESLYGGKFIGKAMVDKMVTTSIENYGYGTRTGSFRGHTRWGHGGQGRGFASYCYYFPDNDLRIIVLSNKEGNVQYMGDAIAGIMLGEQVVMPHRQVAAKEPVTNLERFVGEYKSLDGIVLKLTKNDKGLQAEEGGQLFPLKAASDRKFFWADSRTDWQLSFVIDNKNRVTESQLIKDGLVDKLTKVK